MSSKLIVQMIYPTTCRRLLIHTGTQSFNPIITCRCREVYQCELLIRHGSAIVARGSFEHRIVDADTFEGEVTAHRSTTG